MRDIEIVTASTLSAVGDNGQTLRSVDGGLNWIARPTGLSGTVRAQHWFVDASGIVVGQMVAVRTDDGGVTWEPLLDLSPGTFFDPFNDVAFVDALTGIVIADFTTWKTVDGGQSWAESGHIATGPRSGRRPMMATRGMCTFLS